ncbi:MAG: nucleoside-triphosphatase [Clostridiales bacterium]|nr:nucleoside-triphosphatase [Clostridiales bacterium]
MTEPRHILICGDRAVGKSALIARLLAHCKRPVSGFLTDRGNPDAEGYRPTYIHPAGAAERMYTKGNRVGCCGEHAPRVFTEVFNHLGVQYLSEVLPGGIIVMDELGFMEAQAQPFVRAVFRALDGDIPVLGAVKCRQGVPFLDTVRAHPKAAVYQMDTENRDVLYEQLLPELNRLFS